MAQVSKLSSGIYGSHCNPTLPKTHNNHKPFLGSLLFGSKLKKGSENSLCLSYARVVKNHSAPLRVSASVATAEKPSMSPEIVLQPIKEVSGIVKLPGSKSLSNRILLLAALSEGTTVLDNLLNSDDVHYMLGALRTLGLHVEEDSENKRAVVEGSGGLFPVGKESRDEVHLFLGNAGTAMRPLTAAVTAAGGNSSYVLDGVPRMREKPIGDLVTGLKQLGADVDCFLGTNCPPVRVVGKGGLPGGKINKWSSSSMFLSSSSLRILQVMVETYEAGTCQSSTNKESYRVEPSSSSSNIEASTSRLTMLK